jgi:hypothetical protein
MGKREVPYIRQHQGSFRDEVSLVYIVFGAHVWDTHWGDGMPAQRLFDDGLNIRQSRSVGEGG